MNTLYKLDSKGKIRSWSIEAVTDGRTAEVVTTAGLLDGKKTQTRIVVSGGKNIGRSNETTPFQHAHHAGKS